MKISVPLRVSVVCLVMVLLAGAATSEPAANAGDAQPEAPVMTVHYLEIVTPAVGETCDVLARAHGVEFSDPIPELGNARTADLASGGRLGVRAPMHAMEQPVVRPYVLVSDIHAAVEAAEASGAQVAMPPTEIPGQGTFSIYTLGGIQHGLWQR